MSDYGVVAAAALMESLTWQNICPQCLVCIISLEFLKPCVIFSRDMHLHFNCQNSSVATNAEKLKQCRIENAKQRWQHWLDMWDMWSPSCQSQKWLTSSSCSPHGLFHEVVMNYDIDCMTRTMFWHQIHAMDSMTWSIGLRPRVEPERSIPWLTTSCRLDIHKTIIYIISSR